VRSALALVIGLAAFAVPATETANSASFRSGAVADTLVVPPYLDVMVLDVFRGSPEAGVEVFPPGSASPVRSGIAGVELFSTGTVLATFVIQRPAPGRWIIRKSDAGARVRILSQQFFPRGVLVEPSESPQQNGGIRITYRIVAANGSPLEELCDYPLSLQLSLTGPNGIATVLAMERAADLGPATFRSTSEPQCDLAGRYWTAVRLSTVDADGHRLDVFRDRWSGFSVTPAAPRAGSSMRLQEFHAVQPPRAFGRFIPRWIPAVFFLAIAVSAPFIRRRKP
jgi:hypothetical protein